MPDNDDAAIMQPPQTAEVKQRCGRAWADLATKARRIKSIRRNQVLRLLRDRYGNTLPDNAVSRVALQLLFELDLDGPAAQQFAPWANGNEIDHLIKVADANWIAWSKRREKDDPTTDAKLIPERIGDRLELSFEEYQRLGLTHLRPCDVARHEVDKFIRDRRAERDAERKRHKREQSKKATSTILYSPLYLPNRPINLRRAKSLALSPLADWQWWTTRRLAEYSIERPLYGFVGLDYASARQAVRRAAAYLQSLGLGETKNEPGAHGLKETLVRRVKTAYEIQADEDELWEELRKEFPNPDQDV
jgi:hypothetical protein